LNGKLKAPSTIEINVNETFATVGDALAAARGRLAAHSDTPAQDGQVLLAHLLEQPRSWVLAHPDATLSHAQQEALAAAMARLESGEPLPYVLGEWDFFGLRFLISPAALIPRPETELLLGTALDWLGAHPDQRRGLEVGTGSGCIAAALATHIPDLELVATDISPAALQVARENTERLGLAERVQLVKADLLAGLSGPYDLICANLPYIPSQRLRGLAVYSHEPTLALDGGPDGLDYIARLLEDAPSLLAPGGLVLLEIDAEQEESAQALARAAFPQAKIAIQHDLAGLPRLLVIESKE